MLFPQGGESTHGPDVEKKNGNKNLVWQANDGVAYSM